MLLHKRVHVSSACVSAGVCGNSWQQNWLTLLMVKVMSICSGLLKCIKQCINVFTAMKMSPESEVSSPSPHIISLFPLNCLCSLHWCLHYYLWFGLSGCEYLIMLMMPYYHSLKALYVSLSFPLISSHPWGDTYSTLGGRMCHIHFMQPWKKNACACHNYLCSPTHTSAVHPSFVENEV